MSECSIPLDQENKHTKVELYFCRKKLSCENALSLYESCRVNGKFTLDKNLPEIFICENVKDLPFELNNWPNFTVGTRSDDYLCPFLSESWGCCRMHHILSNSIPSFLLMILGDDEPISWLKDRLLWDISTYPELIGSMHLVLPDPIIRNVSKRLIPETPNKVSVFLELRKDISVVELNDVRLIAIERGTFGIRSVNELKLSSLNNSSLDIILSGDNVEDFSIAIFDKNRGLLEWSSFGSFIRKFDINVRIANAKRDFFLPESGRSYEVTSYEPIKEIKNSSQESNWEKSFHYNLMKRMQVKSAKKYGQHLFRAGDSEEAEEFVRKLIQKAKQRVIIIDPFFATLELFKFVLGISSPVDVLIITGAKTMNNKSKYFSGQEDVVKIGQEILNQIDNFRSKLPDYTINVSVMNGENIIHDCFLVIDDQVWFSGNSLNKIGYRASMLIRLPNPHELLDYLDELQMNTNDKGRCIESLEEWLEKREG